jgi:LPS-assembly lipoprotein
MTAVRQALAVLAVTALLAGCGWHLRGSGGADLDGRPVYVDSSAMGTGDLSRTTARELSDLGAKLADSREAADMALVLLDERTRRRTLSVDRNGRATEYELDYTLQFQVESPAGDVLMSRQIVQEQRAYDTDASDVLGSQSREKRVLRDLRVESVRRMLARAATVLVEGEGTGGLKD